ncbi:MAG: hypothetical protein RLZZ584_4373 [Pseudomonadota bacterium]|jgi:hypothetical protein
MTARASTSSRPSTGLRRSLAVRGRAAACRGITLVGLVFWAALISITAVVALRVIPVVNENYTIARAVSRVAHENATTVNEVRQAFDRVKQVEYAISSISGKDLEISKENDRIVVSYAYDKEIELFGPVYLLLKFRGRSN